MATLQIEIHTVEQATHLCTMADHFLSDIGSMSNEADQKTMIYLDELKTMWEQISRKANEAISNLEEGEN